MRTILLTNLKGGCGKTTIAHHLALLGDAEGYRVGAVDTDRQGDLYRRLTKADERALERPPAKFGKRGGVMYAPTDPPTGETLSASFDLVVVDTPPAMTVPDGLDLVVVPIEGPDSALNANEVVAEALKGGAQRIILVRNGLAEGGPSFRRAFDTLEDDLPDGVVLYPKQLLRGPCVRRTSHTNRAAWSDPAKGSDAKAMRDFCEWMLREAFPPAKRGRAAS